jgi:hypothetical protein
LNLVKMFWRAVKICSKMFKISINFQELKNEFRKHIRSFESSFWTLGFKTVKNRTQALTKPFKNLCYLQQTISNLLKYHQTCYIHN